MTGTVAGGRRRARRSTGLALLVLLLALLLPACAELREASRQGYVPATVHEVEGQDVAQVTFTELGAEKVQLQTAKARTVKGQVVVDYAALIYDGSGDSWVYTVVEPLTYQRVPVVVDRIEGNQVFLTAGLPSGTEVVTVGAALVFGAELHIQGSR